MNTVFDSPEQAAKLISKILTGVVAVVVLASLISSFTVIAPGNTGVIFNIWTGSLRSVPQGMAWRMPWITQVQSYPTALRTYTMVRRTGEGSAIGDDSIDLPTLEGQHITQDISVTYNTSEDKAAQVFKSFRGSDISEIEATFIRRTIITVAQNSAGQMSLSEVISSKRDELQDAIQKNLSVELNKMGFALDKVNLGASHLPQTLEAQMQQKMAAQQQAQRRGEHRSHQHRELGRGEQSRIVEGEVRDEDRHRESDAPEQADQNQVTPAHPLGQGAQPEAHGGDRSQHDSDRLAEHEP